MKTIHQNILNELSGIFVHGVNCQGVMGAGIALAIKKSFPTVYADYMVFINEYAPKYDSRHMLLSKVVYTKVREDFIIASAFTQLNYGRDGERYVSYDAIDIAFKDISDKAKELSLEVMYPKIGSMLGGGSWEVIQAIIKNRLRNVNHNLSEHRF